MAILRAWKASRAGSNISNSNAAVPLRRSAFWLRGSSWQASVASSRALPNACGRQAQWKKASEGHKLAAG